MPDSLTEVENRVLRRAIAYQDRLLGQAEQTIQTALDAIDDRDRLEEILRRYLAGLPRSTAVSTGEPADGQTVLLPSATEDVS